MRTMLNLNDRLMDEAKHLASENQMSLANVIENALREFLSKDREQQEKVKLVTASGKGVQHGVNLDDSRSLREIMDDRS